MRPKVKTARVQIKMDPNIINDFDKAIDKVGRRTKSRPDRTFVMTELVKRFLNEDPDGQDQIGWDWFKRNDKRIQ